VPDSDQTKALRVLTRSRQDLVRTRVVLANQLRDQLACFWPGASKVFTSSGRPRTIPIRSKRHSRVSAAFGFCFPRGEEVRESRVCACLGRRLTRWVSAMGESEVARRDYWPWVSLLPLGLGSWAPIIAAVRFRVWWWGLLGIAGIAACIAGFLLIPAASSPGGVQNTQGTVAGLLLLGSWVGGIVASFAIRPGYDARCGLPARNRPAWPRPTVRSGEWSTGDALFAFSFIFIAVIVVALVLRYIVGVDLKAGIGVLIVEATLLAALMPLVRRRGLSLADLGVRRTLPVRSLWLVFLALGAYTTLSGVWRLVFNTSSERHAANVFSGIHHLGTFDIVLTVVALSLSGPIVDEIFQGLLYRSIRNRLPVPQAALIAGLLFGLLHITGYPLITLPISAAFGVITCLLYERTGSILPGIALQSFVDANSADVSLTGNDTIVLIVAGSLIFALLLRATVLAPTRAPTPSMPLADAASGNSTQ